MRRQADQNYVRGLVWALPPHGKAKRFLALTAYFDESGIHRGDKSGKNPDARDCLMVGHIGDRRVWDRFETDWKAILTEYGLLKHGFHAVDFFGNRKPYKLGAKRREKFLDELLEVLMSHRVTMLGSVVHVPAFMARTKAEREYLTGGQREVTAAIAGGEVSIQRERLKGPSAPNRPYNLAMQTVVLLSLRREVSSDQSVNFIFDRQDQYSDLVFELFKTALRDLPSEASDRMGGPSFENSAKIVALQASDLACYCLKHHLEKTMDKLVERAWSRLRERDRLVKYWDAPRIAEHLKRVNEMLRKDLLS